MNQIQNVIHKVEAVKLAQLTFHQLNHHRFKVDRNCSCCKQHITENNVMFIGENKLGVWFNCKNCDSTMINPTDKVLKGPQVA